MSRLLVTGATGMLGSYVAREALRAGWQVRALVRDPGAAAWLERNGVELAAGDLLSAAALRRAVRSCDAVVHAGALVGSGAGHRSFQHANVIGTENVLEAAVWAGARLVHVSSTAVLGQARYRFVPADEDVPLPVLPAWDAYGRSKQAAERLVLSEARSGRLWAAVVRPPVMYGRRDRQFVPRVAPVLRAGLAPLPGGGRTTLPLVHARSVAQGAMAALGCEGARGRVYHLTDDRPVTVATLWAGAARGLDRPLRSLSVPRPVAAAGFALLAALLTLGGRRDLARHAGGTYRMLTRDNPFTAQRARRELGWMPEVDPEEALSDAFRWWARRERKEAS